jgi:hypothetical protein
MAKMDELEIQHPWTYLRNSPSPLSDVGRTGVGQRSSSPRTCRTGAGPVALADIVPASSGNGRLRSVPVFLTSETACTASAAGTSSAT